MAHVDGILDLMKQVGNTVDTGVKSGKWENHLFQPEKKNHFNNLIYFCLWDGLPIGLKNRLMNWWI